MRRKHLGLARTPDRHGFQSVAALAQVHLSPQIFQHTTGRQQTLSRHVSVCVCMFVTSVCAYLRVGGEQLGVCIIDFGVCAFNENGCFVLFVRMGFGVLLLVSVSLSTKLCVFFPTSAQQTCGHDKMRHFLCEETCFKRNHFVVTGNPYV